MPHETQPAIRPAPRHEIGFAPPPTPKETYAPLSTLKAHEPNVEGLERLMSLAAGAVLLGWGARRRGAARWSAASLGAALLARGVAKRDPMKRLVEPRPGAREVAAQLGWSSAALSSRSITINRPREEVYAAWRDFSRLQDVLENVERIEPIDEKRSHWVVRGPRGETVEWDSEIIDDVKGRRIAWRSVPNGGVRTAGEIEFRDALGGRACEVHAQIAYEPPAGQVGRAVATLLQREPILQTRRDLRRFKQKLETGEIATAATRPDAPRG